MRHELAWLAAHKQTKEQRILPESKAFELDKRIWSLKDTGELRPGVDKKTPTHKTKEFTILGTKCEYCGSYHLVANQGCRRPKHIRFAISNMERR